MKNYWIMALALGLALLGGGLMLSTSAPSYAQDPDPAEAPSYSNEICPFRLPEDVGLECGLMTVLEDRNAAASRAINLQVVHAGSIADAPAETPILLMTGDLGRGSIQDIIPDLETVLNPLVDTHDVYVMDARGTGYSAPGLNCPAVELMYYARLNLNPDAETDAQLASAAIDRCYQRLVTANVLEQYTLPTVAQDFVELQAALGIPEWHVVALGESTRIAFELMRIHPDGIASVVLDSPAPPNASLRIEGDRAVSAAFSALFDACTGTCAANFPDLRKTFLAVVDVLNLQPAVFPVRNPVEGERIDFTLDGVAFANWIYHLIPNDQYTPLLPLIIYQAANGEFVEFARIVNLELEQPALVSEAFRLIDTCTSTVPDTLRPAIETDIDNTVVQALQGPFISVLGTVDCALWPVAVEYSGRYAPVESALPVLLLSGQFTSVVPSAWAGRAAETLPNSTLLAVPGRGDITLDNACTVEVLQQWLRVPSTTLDTACFADLAPTFRVQG